MPTHFTPSSRKAHLLLGLLFLLHLGLGASMGLSVDEAHYLLYGAHPALSYFDHPPLVGWLQWPLVALNVPDSLLRLVPALLWWGTAWQVYHLTLRLAPMTPGAGLGALAVLALAPLLHLLGLGLLPDSLLMFFSVALMGQTWTLMQSGALERTQPWLIWGLLLGMAGLSKYTAIFFALASGLCLLRVHGVALLRTRGIWLAVVLALLMISPVLIWNAQNQWISFSYQAKHGAGQGWSALDVMRFLLVQVLVYGPLFAWAWRGVRQATPAPVPWLVLFFALPFALLAYLSGGGSSLPHWTSPAWVALAPFAGMGVASGWVAGKRVVMVLTAALQGALTLGLLGLMLSAGQPFLPGGVADLRGQPNPFADLHGWEQAGAKARSLAQAKGLHSLAVQNWTLASRLGWYGRPLPVHVLEDRFDQFTLWAGELPQGGDALLVDWSHLAYQVPAAPHGFARCELLDTLDVQRWGTPIARFRFSTCFGWAGEPQPRLVKGGTP